MGRLVIKRKPGESIEIDGPCTITLMGAVSARICIDAPATTKILRAELPGSGLLKGVKSCLPDTQDARQGLE